MQAELQKRVGKQTYDTWLKPTRGLWVRDRLLIVRVPSAHFGHIGTRFRNEIEAALDAVEPALAGVRFEVAGAGPPAG